MIDRPADSPQEPHVIAPSERSLYAPRAWLIFIGVALLVLVADLGSKYWAFANVGPFPIELERERFLSSDYYDPIPPHPGVMVLPFDLLEFKLVVNRGAVFGIGANQRTLFIVFTIFAVGVATVVFAFWTTRRQWFMHTALALIIGGGVGNLYDRIQYAVVRDFLHLMPGPEWRLPFGWRWPRWLGGGSEEVFPWIFNIADVMLLTGMAMLIIVMNIPQRRAADPASRAKPTPG